MGLLPLGTVCYVMTCQWPRQQNQLHPRLHFCLTWSLSDNHLLPVQRRFLQTEAWLCHGLTVVPNNGQPLHGRSWEQRFDYLHRNYPLVQVCGRHLGQNQNKGNGSLLRTYKCREQLDQVHAGRCLPFSDCAVHTEEHKSLNTSENPHTDQYLPFDAHYPPELGWGSSEP